MTTVTSGASAPTPSSYNVSLSKPTLQSRLDDLNSQVDKLCGLLDVLDDRLAPVRVQQPPTAQLAEAEKLRAEASPVGDQLTVQIERMFTLQRRINALLEELEV